MPNLTDLQIEQAILKHGPKDGHHEHPDCIRMAIQWLRAQKRIQGRHKGCAVKHLVESWAGRYVSTSDVIVAAKLIGLEGEYPHFHISSMLVNPCVTRLEGIGQAFRMANYLGRFDSEYRSIEKLDR